MPVRFSFFTSICNYIFAHLVFGVALLINFADKKTYVYFIIFALTALNINKSNMIFGSE
jgi:hypothetical protein